MVMLWMLAGWSRAAIEPSRVCLQAIVSDTSTSVSLEHSTGISADEGLHHQYARAAECVTISGERSGSSLIEGQARASQRTSGGRPLAATLATYARRQIGLYFPHHFTLASAGVAYITSRACDYYVFALRRILD